MSYYLRIIVILTVIAVTCAAFTWRHPKVEDLLKRDGYRKSISAKAHTAARKSSKPKHILRDIPTKTDVYSYIKSLDRIVDFCAANKNDIDLNLAFGLFLVNVNLKTLIKHKQVNVPLLMIQPIRDIVKKNNGLLKFFHNMVKKDQNPGNKKNKAIYSMFVNDTEWVERVDRYDAVFKTDKVKKSFAQLQAVYDTWEVYMWKLYDWKKGSIPGPKLSDHCTAALASQPIEVINSVPMCILPSECHHMLINGSNFGYALTHRLMLMITARYGRGCAIFSPARDRELTTEYCKAAYAEAEYIAMHHYKVIDLLMEQIALCTLEGHVEFYQRTWLLSTLNFQTNYGCYTMDPEKKVSRKRTQAKNKPWVLSKRTSQQSIQDGACNGHLTATAGAALSGAVRFVVTTAKFPQYGTII